MNLNCVSSESIMKSDEEIGREKPTGPAAVNHNHYNNKNRGSETKRMLDITRDKPIKVAVRVIVPVKDHPKFNFVGKLLGPKGNSLKRLQEDTMCKMAVLGRGSMRDRLKEEELRASGDPKFQHLSEELHVEISAFATPAEAHARIAYALAEVRRFLVPDYNDDIRQEQMWEMQVLSNQRNNGKGEEVAKSLNSGTAEFTSGDERLSTETAGESGSQSSQDSEHPALRGIHPGHDVELLLGGLKAHKSLSMLDLAANRIGDHGVTFLAEWIRTRPNLIALRLPANKISNSGAKALSLNLSFSRIRLLDLQHNKIGDQETSSNLLSNASILETNGKNQLSSADEVNGSDEVIPQSLANVAGRKRPLLAIGPRTAMTPTKRTVMSLLAKARAAQAKHITTSYSGTTAGHPPTLVPLLREDFIAGGVNLSLI